MRRSRSASPVQTRDQRRMHQRQWQWHRAVSHERISHSGQYKLQQNRAGTRRVQLRGPEPRQQRSGDISKQNKCHAAACSVFYTATMGHMGAGRVVFTDGTVFILAENQAAGESSLVEAPVTTSRALWHVKVPG